MKVRFLLFETYVEAIRKSIGSSLFQTTWGEINGKKKDLTNKGQFSCATHISSILMWFAEQGLLKTRHVKVSGLIKDMEGCGWHKIKKPRVGAVIHWENFYRNGSANEHLGFYIGNGKTVTNDSDVGTPQIRPLALNGKRKILGIYWHPELKRKHSNG